MVTRDVSPLLAIVGETASGKSALALELATKLGGEIICADSRTVYQEMNIGTAKPSRAERAAVPHHLLDVVRPNQPFSVAQFQALANQAIDDITSRGKLPILVGGSGLYIDAILFGFDFGPGNAVFDRSRVESLTTESLQLEVQKKGLSLPINATNRRHLQALLSRGQPARNQQLRDKTMIIGLRLDRETLQQRITARVDQMFDDGLVNEAQRLSDRYGWDVEPMKTPAYQAVRQFLAGTISELQAKNEFIKSDLKLAKKQRTWFKRNNSIHWVNDPSASVELVTTILNKIQ